MKDLKKSKLDAQVDRQSYGKKIIDVDEPQEVQRTNRKSLRSRRWRENTRLPPTKLHMQLLQSPWVANLTPSTEGVMEALDIVNGRELMDPKIVPTQH